MAGSGEIQVISIISIQLFQLFQISSETTYAITKKNRRTTIETNRSNPPKQSIIAEPRYNWGPLSTPLSFLARFFLSLLRAARDDLIDRSCRHDRIKPRNGQPRAKKKEEKKEKGVVFTGV